MSYELIGYILGPAFVLAGPISALHLWVTRAKRA